MSFYKLTLFVLFVAITSSCSSQQANYSFVGKYPYKITDKILFSNTYLSEDSYGFLIGDLEIQGIEIQNINKLNLEDDYIIIMNHPILTAYTDSDLIDGEVAESTSKKPLDITKDLSITSNDVYIYKLIPKGKYRLLMP